MRIIDADNLSRLKFAGNKFVQIGGRSNGKTLEAVNRAYQQGWNDAIDVIINDIPTVERPQGEWVIEDKPFGGFGDSVLAITCSICKESYVYRDTTHNFCPNCGADMRKETDND